MSVEVGVRREVTYPESDGKPMADNTLQAHYIVYLFDNLKALFRNEPNVFVAADLLWYPVEGEPSICTAPDVMVVFGRPKGHRRSYLQWQEGNIAPQVVFEVWSPTNSVRDFLEKLSFYERYGVEEFYLYDPDKGDLMGWIRKDERLVAVEKMEGWVSPRLEVKFTLEGKDLVVYYPDGEPFVVYEELREQWLRERQRAEKERERAEQERRRAEQERQRAERLAQRLRELGIEPEE
ncbi:MAG: Uma2 family endonuclease [Armatimonadetes bacterium]|nr:Uma2 family endonuclease [Armatimonadota bacterium]MDW8027075.1 Uma2 family endonuclease [Armatimonadota bacterium]